jgi:hypothetical protein
MAAGPAVGGVLRGVRRAPGGAQERQEPLLRRLRRPRSAATAFPTTPPTTFYRYTRTHAAADLEFLRAIDEMCSPVTMF